MKRMVVKGKDQLNVYESSITYLYERKSLAQCLFTKCNTYVLGVCVQNGKSA